MSDDSFEHIYLFYGVTNSRDTFYVTASWVPYHMYTASYYPPCAELRLSTPHNMRRKGEGRGGGVGGSIVVRVARNSRF